MNCPLKLVKLDQQELPEKPSDKPTGSLEIDGCLFSAADGDLVVTGSTTATLDDPTFASGGSHMFLVIETSLDDYKRIVLVANTESSDVGAICQNTAGEWNNCDLDETWNIVMPLDGDVDTYPAHWMLHYQLNQTSDPKLRSPMLHMVNNIGDLLSWRCEMNLPLTDVFYTGRLSNSVDKQVVKEHEIAEKVVETKALPSPNSSEDDAAVLKNDTPANLDAQKPALKELQSAATLSDKAKSGFNFGDSTFSELPKAGFNFAPKTEAPKAGFNFGASTATPAIPQSGFSFNASKAQEMPQSGFGFGAAKALDIPKPVFSFAVSKDSKAEVAPPTIPTVQKLQLGSQIINPIVKSAEVISSATKIPMAGVGVPNTPDKGIILTKTGLVKSNTPEKSATSKLAKDVLPESKASSRTPKKGANQSKPLSTKKQILKPAEDEGSMYISLQSDLDGLNTYINDVKSNILKIAKSSDMIHIGSESKRITSQIKFLERLLESLSWPYATSIDIKEKCSEISAEIQSAKNILEQAIPNGGLSHEAARLRDILMDKCAACEESLLNLESIANRNEEDTPTYLTIIATINGMRISIKQLNAKFHHFDMQLPKKIKPSTPQKVKSTHRGGFGIRGGDIYADDFPVPQANNEPINQADDEKLREALKKSLNMQQVPKNTAVEYRTAHDAAHVVVPQGPIDMSLYITEEKAADDLRIVELEKLEILKQSETASVVLADIDASSELDAGQSVAETGEDDYQEGEFEADDDTDDFDEEDFDDQEGSEEYSQQESAAIQSFLNDGVQNDDLSETGESNAVPVASSAFFTTAASSSFSVGAKNSPFESAYKPKLDVTEAQISKPVSAFSFGRVNNAASRSAKSADETSESQKMQASKVSTVKPLDISVLSVTGTSTEAMKVKAISNPIQIQPQPAIAKLSEVINEKPYVPEANALQTVFEKMLATPDIDLETPVHEMEADTPAVQTQIEVASLKTNDTIFSDNADSFFGSRVPKNAINPMFGAVKPAGNDHFDLESTNLPAISFGESIFGTSGQSVTPFGSSTQSSHANFANAPAFGAAAGMQPKPFGAASTTVFGQSTFAINATQSTPPKPFGATPFSQSAFQGTAAQSTPSSTFGGATGTFAKPLADVGEAAAQPSAFGQVSTFGGVSKFGQSGFGGSTSQTAAFDQAASSAGNAVAFGSSGDPSMRDFGNAPTASSFGQISAPAFGQSSMGGPAFGRSSMAQSSFGSSSFGQPSNSKHIIDPQALETSGFSAFAAPSSGFASFAQSSNSQQALPQAQFNTKSSFAPSSANSSSFSGFRE